MEENIKKLKTLFNNIKDTKFTKSLRNGTTGIGYTFESLIGKNEDNSFFPDFEGIEIKTKLGYSKSPLTLFCLVPKKDNANAIRYIVNSFGYPTKNSSFKSFRGNVYNKNNNIIANRYILKIKVDKKENKLVLIIKNIYLETIADDIYWNLEDLKKRLFTKLNYLAFIKAYPYKKNNEIYYKYTSLEIYKLKNFEKFLELIEQDKVFITFNIGFHTSEEKYGQINDRGTAFRISTNAIEDLFDKVN